MTNAQNHTAGIDWAISISAGTSSREQHEIWAPGDAYFCVELASFLFVYLLVCFLSQSSQLFSQWASIRPEESIDTPKFDVACVAGAWKKRAKERTGAREGDTQGVSLLLAPPFFLVPTTSKRLLRRLSSTFIDCVATCNMRKTKSHEKQAYYPVPEVSLERDSRPR